MTYKTLLSLLCFLSLSLVIHAQENYPVLDSIKGESNYVTFKFNQFKLKDVTTARGVEKIVQANKTTSIMKEGAPNLPKFAESLIIPDEAAMKVEVISSKYKEYTNVSIAPSKGNLSRAVNPDDVPYRYGEAYQKNEFYPNTLSDLSAAFIARDYRGQTINVYPFQYNPVTKILRVYSEIKVKVSPDSSKRGENIFKRTRKVSKPNKQFDAIYKRQFINYQQHKPRYTAIEEEGNMLIICYDPWVERMQPFVEWKNTIGRPTEIVSVTDAGSSSASIKNYIENYYNQNGLAYVLLVGDSQQIPAMSSYSLGGDSDNAYGYISGSDHYQEVIIGRFSAESGDHVDTQVQRTIAYEKGNELEDGFLNKVLGVTSNQGPGDDNEYDYEHFRNIAKDLFAFTYESPAYELFDGSQGGQDAPGDPSPYDVADAINEGVGIINYTGHGADDSWVSSDFAIDHVKNLQNYNRLPFIFNVACVNGNFVGQTCFAESWLRAESNDQPIGAIAIVASTINQSWRPPMVGQDEMNDILVGESQSGGTKRTFGGIIVNGFYQMMDETNDVKMTDTWTCFGDPSVLLRTDNPSTMVVTHEDKVSVDRPTFSVKCNNIESGRATLSHDGEIIGSAVVNNGVAEIPIEGLDKDLTLTLAVTAFNKVTYLKELKSGAASGPFLVLDSYTDHVSCEKSTDIDITLKNTGTESAQGVTAKVTSSNSKISISDAQYSYGSISAGSSSKSSKAFTVSVNDDVEDQSVINLDVKISDASGKTWNETAEVLVDAPNLEVLNVILDDSSGNNDGDLDQGEKARLIVIVANNGHADLSNIKTSFGYNSDCTISTIDQAIDLAIGEDHVFIFNIEANSSVAEGTKIKLDFTAKGGKTAQYTAEKEISVFVGNIDYCDAHSESGYLDRISNVKLNTIDNNSKGSNYTDFTDISTDLSVGESYPITITNGNNYSNGKSIIRFWIDWNKDGDFEDEGEEYKPEYSNDTSKKVNGIIEVPVTANLGKTRLRIGISSKNDLTPCATIKYGEFEDYTINVVDDGNGNILAIDLNELTNNGLGVYPNPNNGKFTLEIDEDLFENNADIDIFNSFGQFVYHTSVKQTKTELKTSIASGLYFVRIKSGEHTTVTSIIIE